MKLPLSVSLWEGDGYCTSTPAVASRAKSRRAGALRWRSSARWSIARVLFGEVAREGSTTFVHGGVRYWVKRDRLAIDFSLQRERGDGTTRNGAVIGIGWYDL